MTTLRARVRVRTVGEWRMEGLARIGFGLFGLAVLIGIAWLFSNNKKAVDWKLVATGIALQIAFAALVLLVPGGKDVFDALGNGFVKILSFVGAGSNFIFGSLMDTDEVRLHLRLPGAADDHLLRRADGRAVPPRRDAVRSCAIMALAITKVMRVSGAETTSVCASVFIGQTEAPLTVRPYISQDDRIRTDHDDDRRHGAHRRRRAGGLRRHARRRRSGAAGVLRQAPAGGHRSWPRRRRWWWPSC